MDNILCIDTQDNKFNPRLTLDYTFCWKSRQLIETDPRFKQIIPYVILYDTQKEIYAQYTRIDPNEKRLEDKHSIGVGGHVDDIDEDRGNLAITNTIQNAINRELTEEIPGTIWKQGDWWNYFRGFIYDPSNEVGQVHVGLVFLRPITIDDRYSFVDTEHIFLPISYPELFDEPDTFEYWSQVCMNAVIDKTDTTDFYRRENGV